MLHFVRDFCLSNVAAVAVVGIVVGVVSVGILGSVVCIVCRVGLVSVYCWGGLLMVRVGSSASVVGMSSVGAVVAGARVGPLGSCVAGIVVDFVPWEVFDDFHALGGLVLVAVHDMSVCDGCWPASSWIFVE